MVTTPPILPNTQGKVQAVSPVSATNQILSLPQGLLPSLPRGGLLKALVAASNQPGQVVLQTTVGNITLKTALPLQAGSHVQVHISTPGNQVQVQIVTIDDQPPEIALPRSYPSGETVQEKMQPFLFKAPLLVTTAPAPLAEAATVQTHPEGVVLQGVVVSAKPEAVKALLEPFTVQPESGKLVPATSRQPAPALPSGQVVMVRVVASYVPAVTGQPQPTPSLQPLPLPQTDNAASPRQTVYPPGKFPYANPVLLQAMPTAALPVITAQATGETTIPAPPLPSSQPAPTGASSAAAPQAVAPEKPPVLPLPQVNGVVVGSEKSGDTLVQTPIGTIKLTTDTPIPKHAEVTLEIVAIPAPVANAAAIPLAAGQAKDDGIQQLFKQWAVLEEGSEMLQKQQPDAAALLRQKLPAPDKQLGVKLSQFVEAVRTGNIEQWLGKETVHALRQHTPPHMLEQLSKDFSAMQKLMMQPDQISNWQTVLFPVYDGKELHQARMFVRYQEEEGEKKQGRGKQTRFVVEVDLARLGALQFDGLVMNRQPAKRFDLVIRSQKELPEGMQHDITQIFISTQEVTGMVGKLAFEAVTPFPVQPLQEVLAGQGYDEAPSIEV